MVQDWRSIK